MPLSRKSLGRIGIGLAVAVVLGFVCVRAWVVPALIVGQIEARVGGKVTIRDWWLNGRSAGVVGLALREGPGSGSPSWASAERVTTDLTLGGVLRGRFTPGRLTLVGPEVDLRLDRDGRFLNLPSFPKRGAGGATTAMPEVLAEDARVSFRQEGRPEMIVSRVAGRLRPEKDALELSAEADDPAWGHWGASGSIDPDFGKGVVRLASARFAADPKKLASVPFVPPEVWANVAPTGPAGLVLDLGWGRDAKAPVKTRTEVTFLGTSVDLPTLGLVGSGATGRLVIEDGVVRVDRVEGQSIGGRVAASGALDFTRKPPRIDLDLDLSKVNVADAPKKWQLDEAGITGLLTGKVKLRVVLAASGADLSGTSGEGVVEGGTIQGIPFKTLKLAMQARGQDLQYNTKPASDSASLPSGWPGQLVVRGAQPQKDSSLSLGISRVATRPGQQVVRATRGVGMLGLVALQAPPEAKKEGVRLPKSLTTQLELEDVDIAQLIERAKFLLGAPIPVPITGRMSLKAEATVPLGALRDVKSYTFHGDLTLTGASIYRVDFGRLAARIDLADGVLELTNLRGRLVDRPDGGPDNPPSATAPEVAKEGPLPPGGFRANLRAELSPPGRLTVKFDGNQLPLGELAAPVLPRPTPLSGLATLGFEASADLGRATDPDAWTVSGRGESVHVSYKAAALDSLTLRFGLKGGKLDVPELAARLLGHPLVARGLVDLKPPREFRGTLDVTGWDLAAMLALVPGAPRPSPVVGELTAHAEANGTGSPWSIETQGRGQFTRFQAGPVALGEVPFRWTTEGDTIDLSVADAHPFGGTVTGEARVPVVSGKPTVGSATFIAIDASRISAAMPGQDLKLTGKADGRVEFSIPSDVSALEAAVKLSAPDLTVQGIPAEQVQAAVQARKGVLKYEVTADSLGGKVKFQGDFPLNAAPAPMPIPSGAGPNGSADGEIRAAGFVLDQLWRALGVTGVLAKLDGQGALAANVRDVRAGPEAGLYAHGVVELRNLVWGEHPLGQLRGIVAKWPASWRIESLTGELLGGQPSGFLWGTTPARGPKRLGFDFRIANASLKRASAFVPALARDLDGFGTFRLSGNLGDSFQATAEVDVAHARFAGLPLTELKAPADLTFVPGGVSGVLQVRRWSARLAGGQLRGDAWFHLGEDRAFRADAQLASLDIQAFTRLATDVRRPASGRVSGRVMLSGTDPMHVSGYRGRVVLDLDDASLVSLPIIRELDRFLGSARGGVFEDGDLTGTIANRQLFVEQLTLEGRLVQLHATGTVGFDGQLNLEVLVNTNQIIPQSGMALVGLIPGLREVLGRSQEAVLRVANYLSNRLLKIRVTGTLKNPSVSIDPSVAVADTAVGFFAGVLKLPLGLAK